MAISVSAHQHLGTTYKVATKRCIYSVQVSVDVVLIQAPGLDYEIDREESKLLADPDLSGEGAAAIAVIFFEESNQ